MDHVLSKVFSHDQQKKNIDLVDYIQYQTDNNENMNWLLKKMVTYDYWKAFKIFISFTSLKRTVFLSLQFFPDKP